MGNTADYNKMLQEDGIDAVRVSLDAALRRAKRSVEPVTNDEPVTNGAVNGPGTASGASSGTSSASGASTATSKPPNGVTLDDFNAYMPMHNYIFSPSLEPWPSVSVDARIPPQPLLDAHGNPVLKDGVEQTIKASAWLDRNKPVVQMTWAPGEPAIIQGKLTSDGGWIIRPGVRVLNLFRPAIITRGNAHKAEPWLAHIRRIYGDDAEHIIRWLAQRAQQPQVKINHGLVLSGPQGVGKDSLLAPVRVAVGPWNFKEVNPKQITGRFNDFVMSVILRISEARDLGEVDRYAFYEATKVFMASPPEMLRVDQKHLREFSVFNVTGIIITSNHKLGGIFLPPDDRRHYVAWTNATKGDFSKEYWNRMWEWYEKRDGLYHVAVYLRDLDISDFDPKAPPPQTEAWHDIVSSSRSPEESELADAIDRLGNPGVVTLVEIIDQADPELREFMSDKKNSRVIPHRLEACDYVAVRNDSAKDGLWVINGKRKAVYAKKNMTVRDQRLAIKDRYLSSEEAAKSA